MIENKRFSVKQRQGATIYSIIDYYGELPLNEGMYYKSNAEKLCKWLNTQHELLNTLYNENEQLKQQVQNIHKLIDKKIDEFKDGDYGDLPCNTIHMFLDLKEEIGDV